MAFLLWRKHRPCIGMVQIDEFIATGTLSALEEAGGFAKPAQGEAKPKAKGDDAMALKFL